MSTRAPMALAGFEDRFLDLVPMLEKRRAAIRAMLEAQHPLCFTEQKHADAGTDERAYWHHGYMMALVDVLSVIRNGRSAPPPAPSN